MKALNQSCFGLKVTVRRVVLWSVAKLEEEAPPVTMDPLRHNFGSFEGDNPPKPIRIKGSNLLFVQSLRRVERFKGLTKYLDEVR